MGRNAQSESEGFMIGARNNPSRRMVCGSEEEREKQRNIDKADYNFYARALRIIYNKPKLRNKMLERMKEIEGTVYHRTPRQGIAPGGR